MAIRKTINKDKSDFETTTDKNAETSATLKLGSPVIYKCTGALLTDGLDVIAPSSSTAVKATSLFAGILMRDCVPGDIAEAAINGFVQNGLLARGTRAATTAAWPSFQAIALGDQLVIDTVMNAWVYSTVGAQGANTPLCVVADGSNTWASTTTAASNAFSSSWPQWSTATIATILMKMIVRNM